MSLVKNQRNSPQNKHQLDSDRWKFNSPRSDRLSSEALWWRWKNPYRCHRLEGEFGHDCELGIIYNYYSYESMSNTSLEPYNDAVFYHGCLTCPLAGSTLTVESAAAIDGDRASGARKVKQILQICLCHGDFKDKKCHSVVFFATRVMLRRVSKRPKDSVEQIIGLQAVVG